MPVGVKDIIETRDFPTENGTAFFKGWCTNRDAASVTALREAGAVILGKTVTTEFATAPPGPTHNPWDTATHARWLVFGIGRGDGQRHDLGGPRHASARLDPAPGQFLRLCRLQAEPWRDQS